MRKIASLIVLLILVVSCAQEAPNPFDGTSMESFRSWMKKNAPNAKEISNDVYIEYYTKGNIPGDTLKITPYKSWITINYTGRTLNKSIFVTRDSTLSRLVGKWLPTTHFIDDFVVYDDYSNKICMGLRVGLSDMKRGDSARIYIPSYLGYPNSMSVNSGYLGEDVTYEYSPIYFDIKLKNIINEPAKYEEGVINDWVYTNWQQFEKDTLTKGAYMKITKSVPTGEAVKKDSTIRVSITETFLDNFIITTDSEAIARANGIYDASKSYTPKDITVGGDATLHIYNKALPKLRRGEEAIIVANSLLTPEGNKGSESSTPEIQSFTPRMYKIRVFTKEEESKK